MGYLNAFETRASPRLKDAQIPSSSCESLYAELVLTIRKIYHQCKLVHADLSEYNILYHNSHLYIIDVSQSVEHDHPSSFDFLRNDIKNIEEYFGRLGVKCLGLRRCFEFVTTGGTGEDERTILGRWLAEDAREDVRDTSATSAHEDSVFFQSFIPRSLNEVYNPERDVAVLNRGGRKELIYADTIGLVQQASSDDEKLSKLKVDFEKVHVTREEGTEESESDSDDEEEDDERQSEGYVERKPRGHRHEDRDDKKVRSVLTDIIDARC